LRNRFQTTSCTMAAEGVVWAPKDLSLPEHPNIKGVSNLHVIKAMQSFESRDLVTGRYAWRQHYWFLTDKGIEYLREYLNIPSNVAPATLMRQVNRYG
jgi:small subunit ribosomal protein S10e